MIMKKSESRQHAMEIDPNDSKPLNECCVFGKTLKRRNRYITLRLHMQK